jgi:hypothetical protein
MDYKKIIEYLLLSAITGIAGTVSRYISKMNESLERLTSVVQETNIRLEAVHEWRGETAQTLSDHELRLRECEKKW